MPSIGDARRVDGAWEVFLDEYGWIPLDDFPLPQRFRVPIVRAGIHGTDNKIIFLDAKGDWWDLAGEPQERGRSEADDFWAPTVAALVSTAITTASIAGFPDWKPDAEELAELRIFAQTYSSDDAHRAAQNLAIRSILPETEAAELASLEAVYETWGGGPPSPAALETIRTHLANKNLTSVQRVTIVKNLAQSLAPTEVPPTEDVGAPEPYFETERRRVEARRATEVAQKSRSAEEQFDAALDAGDLDKARLIRNFLDEPSEWQIELLKMEYADNLPALKILFDYVDAIGRADVVPEEARALVEQPADADARLRMLDFAAWQKTQPPQEPTQGPPGFGGVSYGMPAAEATAEEQKRSVFGGVGDIPPMETAGQAIRRLDPDLAEAVALVTGEPVMRHSGTPIPSVPVLTSEMMASPIFQQALQTTKGTANEPIVKLLVDGIEWPLPASQYADFVKQRISWGETVEMPNREKGIWETLYVGDDGSIQVRPTVRPFKKGEFGERYFDDESVRFGRTGEQFVVPQRFTAEQIVEGSQFIPGGEQLGEEPPVFQQYPGSGVPPLAPFSLSQAEAGRPEGLPFTVTQETMDKIKSQQRIGLDPGEAHFVDPVTGQSGVMDFKTEADIEEFKKQRPGWVEVARTDPIPVAEPVFGPSRAEREATFIKEAQAFAPPPTFKKTPRPFGTPRFVTT